MKRKYIFFSLLFFCLFLSTRVYPQCSGGCPTGALTTLPATSTLAAGTNYCITGPLTTTTTYTISDTLVISSGTVSLGAVTLNSTGVIIVLSGAKLILNGLNGQYGVASTKSNLVVCGGGFVQVTGTFQQYGMNMVLNDYAIFLVTGSWNAYASTPFYVDIGMGALVEDCGALTINTNEFFTETSGSTSYVLIRGSITQGVTPGWLSSKESGSLIDLTVQGSVSGLSYNTATSCVNSCTSTSLLPPGTTTTTSCGSTSNSYIMVVLTAQVSTSSSPTSPSTTGSGGEPVEKTTVFPNPFTNYVYVQLPSHSTYSSLSILSSTGQLLLQKNLTTSGGIVRVDLPAWLAAGIYFVKLSGAGEEPLLQKLLKN